LVGDLECSAEERLGSYSVAVEGTIRATRSVEKVRVQAFIGDQLVNDLDWGLDAVSGGRRELRKGRLLGDMEAGEIKRFSIENSLFFGTVTSQMSCHIDATWLYRSGT